MQSAEQQTLVHIRTLRHLDGRLSGPYQQCWTDAATNGHIFQGAEFKVELDPTRDIRIRVLTAHRQPPHVSGATVVPEITAEEIANTPL
jgi:hypothetical protein